MKFFRTIDTRLWWILALAAALIFFRIAHVDMTGDDAHYSVRAVGLADFMFGDADFQSTPLLWFDETPWWARLSFHDHPKLLFVIQHLFLSVSDSIFFAKLPYALMALGSVLLIYLLLRRMAGDTSALLGALFLALHAHVLWTGRVAFMEAGVIFFTLLAFLSFERFLADRRRWWEFGLGLGAALSVKFTTIYLLPVFGLFLLLRRRELFRAKELSFALAAAVVVLSPVIAYNVFMYQAVGHFSLQFARLFGQTTPWGFGGITTAIGPSALSLVVNLGTLMSWPYFAVWMLALWYSVARLRGAALLPLLGTLFLGIQQALIGQGGYVLAPFAIFAAMLVALAAKDFLPRLRIPAIAFAAYLLVFAVNSHALVAHRGPVGWLRSQVTSDNYGVAQLDAYLDTLLGTTRVGEHDIFWYVKKPGSGLEQYLANVPAEEMKENLRHATVILYDGNLNWFSRVWLFERRRFYDNAPFISTNEQHLLDQLRIADLYLIVATDAAPLDTDAYRNDTAARLAEELFADAAPTFLYRDDGAVAFKVYHADKERLQGEAS